MALLVVGSAKGSPGATTAALAIAALWPRAVLLADCDPAGGDVAARMPSAGGGALDPDRGLVSLAAAGRNGLHAALFADHVQQLAGGLDVLAGPRSAEQSTGLDAFWPSFAAVAASIPGLDVVADVGRVTPGTPVLPLLRTARLLVLVARPSISSVVHLRARLATLASPEVVGPHVRTAVALVSAEREGGDARAVTDALTRLPAPPERIWRLVQDARGAAVFDGRPVRHPERTDLARSAAVIALELAQALKSEPAQALKSEPEPAGAPDTLVRGRHGG